MTKTWRLRLSVIALYAAATSATPTGPLVGKAEWTPMATISKARQLVVHNLEHQQHDLQLQQPESQQRIDVISGEGNLGEEINPEGTTVSFRPHNDLFDRQPQHARDSFVMAEEAPSFSTSQRQELEHPQQLYQPRRAQVPKPRGPPRPRPRPRPRPGIIGGLSNLGSNIKCKAEDIAADSRLKDRDYMQRQINCVLDRGPCDRTGNTIKRLAPEVLRGVCPAPCDRCKRRQIQKVMAIMSQEYQYEWNQMLQHFGNRGR